MLQTQRSQTLQEYLQESTSRAGKARMRKLTKEQRRQLALKGAEARWAKRKKQRETNA